MIKYAGSTMNMSFVVTVDILRVSVGAGLKTTFECTSVSAVEIIGPVVHLDLRC